ncbi:hypothetical protein EVC62_15775 [Salinicola endophyticus]|uniref:Flagellar hook-length control protein-like C-terminal domain-containing protein n=1 Tax=Salinicola endophyticus TaxID=1949083 RepID=A0ABY8FJW9_9GAMM|nr:flagellar hook-length control protein FliK [Salinicola endophyticus]WFF42837.1 hypothetical protein EVC62_15775 [Salinicola endophyticus]
MTAAGDKAASAKSSGDASPSTSFAAALTQAGAQPRSPSDTDASGSREARPATATDAARLTADTSGHLPAEQADGLAKLALADSANASGDDIAEALSALAKAAGASEDSVSEALIGADGKKAAVNEQTDALTLAALFAGLQPLSASADPRAPTENRAGQALATNGLAGSAKTPTSANVLASAIGLATRDLAGQAPADDGEASRAGARALSSALDSAAAQRHSDTLAQRDPQARAESPLAALLTRAASGQQAAAQAQAAAGKDAPLTAEQLAARTQATAQGTDLSALTRGHGAATEANAGFAGQLQQQSGAPMAMTANASPAAMPSHSLPVAVQSPQWPASLGQQVLQMQQRGDNQMELKLHPRELGALSVSLNVHDNQAQLQILSAHAPVRAAVEAALPQLREALAQSGIALGEAMVGDQGQFQREQQENDGRGAPGGTHSATGLAALDEPADAATAALNTLLGGRGNINLYA